MSTLPSPSRKHPVVMPVTRGLEVTELAPDEGAALWQEVTGAGMFDDNRLIDVEQLHRQPALAFAVRGM